MTIFSGLTQMGACACRGRCVCMSWMNRVHVVEIPCAWRLTKRRGCEGLSKSSDAVDGRSPLRGDRRRRRCFDKGDRLVAPIPSSGKGVDG